MRRKKRRVDHAVLPPGFARILSRRPSAAHMTPSDRHAEPLAGSAGLLIAVWRLACSLALFLLVPLLLVFSEALENGVKAYFAALVSPDALHAIYLTGLAAAVSVPMGTLFGLAAAWSIAKFQFAGKNLLDHADRPAVFRLAGHRRAALRASLQSHARLLRSLAGRATAFASSSPSRALSLPRCS